MVWLGLVLLIVAFRRGWVLAPMFLFVFPFVVPVVEASLLHRGMDLGFMIPHQIEGLTAQIISLAGLLLLSFHQRRV